VLIESLTIGYINRASKREKNRSFGRDKIRYASLLPWLLQAISLARYFDMEFEFGQVTIEPGWPTEPPPVEQQLNDTEVLINAGPNNPPVRNAFANLPVSVQKRELSKELTFLPGEETDGHYLAEIFPTQTGAYSLVFKGQVERETIQTTVPIEDIEDLGRLEFLPQVEGLDSYVAMVVEDELLRVCMIFHSRN
jgi:hypothetical protein